MKTMQILIVTDVKNVDKGNSKSSVISVINGFMANVTPTEALTIQRFKCCKCRH